MVWSYQCMPYGYMMNGWMLFADCAYGLLQALGKALGICLKVGPSSDHLVLSRVVKGLPVVVDNEIRDCGLVSRCTASFQACLSKTY